MKTSPKALRVSASKSVRKPRAVKSAAIVPPEPTPEPAAPVKPAKRRRPPAQRTFTVTLTKRDAYLIRDFSTLCNCDPALAIGFMAGYQFHHFMVEDKDDGSDWHEFYARKLAAYRIQRERTLAMNGGRVHP
jgi:hypothetical protein